MGREGKSTRVGEETENLKLKNVYKPSRMGLYLNVNITSESVATSSVSLDTKNHNLRYRILSYKMNNVFTTKRKSKFLYMK